MPPAYALPGPGTRYVWRDYQAWLRMAVIVFGRWIPSDPQNGMVCIHMPLGFAINYFLTPFTTST